MVGDIISLASYGYYGGVIGDMFLQWEEAGFFSYVLPFLLIFAIVFGILSSMKLFKDNRAIDAIIALAVGLMALQFEMVPMFFSQIFPRLGIALSVILVILILAGFFVNPKQAWIMYTFLGIGLITAIVVLITSAGQSGSYIGYIFYDHLAEIIFVIFVLAGIGIVVGSTVKKEQPPYVLSPWRD